MEEHSWIPFTEDLVICERCGNVEDEAVSEPQWRRKDCTPDPILSGGF